MPEKIYLDHSATTPVDKEVLDEMLPYFTGKFGNAASVHSFGQEALEGVDIARERVANFLSCSPEEVIFTSGATESNNTVINGVAEALADKGNHIITSAIEHHCVLDTCKALKKEGFDITFLPVDKDGLVNPEDVSKAIKPETILVSVMYVNNEVGTIQPIKEISEITRKKKILFHTDAVQAANYLDCSVDHLGVDFLSLSAHKIYGPKGVGALYVRKKSPLRSLMHGGAQEYGLRPGTHNVPGIVGLGKAIDLIPKFKKDIAKITKLRDKLIDEVLKKVPDSHLNGSLEKRVPANANFSFKNVEGESILLSLDLEGIAISTGSACTSGSLEPSHVLTAMNIPPEISHGSLRVTLGKENTEAEIDRLIDTLVPIIKRLREMSPQE